jgi:peptide chain release factor 1
MPKDLKRIKEEYQTVLQQLSNPELISNWEKFEQLSKRKSSLEKIIEKEKELKEVINKIKEKKLEKEFQSLLNSNKIGVRENKAVIVEVRAGTGGKEAALFAGDLFRMYSKYSQFQGWQQKILNSHPTELGGFKEIIFELRNGNIFSKMKYEGGVHRVQRIPETEKLGRIHTSTASVAVLPKPKGAIIKIKPEDLKIDFYRASGPGGQYVNRRETAVRITHLPTGLVVTSQTERSQLQNKENALTILEAELLEEKELEEVEKIGDKRKTQIGRAKRAEKIRTYNFPQDRVTDHRIKKSWHNLTAIMEGKLEPIIKALEKRGN